MVVLLLSLVLAGGGFGWRLVDLQLTPDEELAVGIGSQVRAEGVAAPRGDILDRHGRPIALSLPRPSIVANPQLLQAEDERNAEIDLLSAAVADLSLVLSTDPAVIRERLSRDKAFVFLERQVDPEIGEAVRAMKIPGVYIDEEQRREHPVDDCSGLALIGRVDVDQFGVSGLELRYDDHLTGSAGSGLRQTQAGGQVQIPGGFRTIDEMEPGRDLTTTIDRNIQFETEQRAIAVAEETRSDRVMVLVGIPGTGEILAAVNVVRDEETGIATCTTTNSVATRVYEPGSTMKALTFASVFENDAWSERDPIPIPYRIEIDLGDGVTPFSHLDHTVPVEGASHPPRWVLRKSSNNGTITMAQALGPEPLYDTLVDFGFGRVTSLGLPGEASGILDPLDSNALALSNVAIGQGIAVTPLQMLQAYSTLGAGGLRFDPVVVRDEVGNRDPVRVVSAETAATVVDFMRQVVIDGTGTAAAVAGYDVAGKTGTSWQPCEGGVAYYCADGSRLIVASFAGIVGNDDGAGLSIVVVIENPRSSRTGGGAIAAPLFADVAGYALGQLRIAPLSGGVHGAERVQADAAVAGDEDLDPEAP